MAKYDVSLDIFQNKLALAFQRSFVFDNSYSFYRLLQDHTKGMNLSNSAETDSGLLPTSSTHPGSKAEQMSNDELSDSDVSFDDDDDDDDPMHDTSGTSTIELNQEGSILG